MHVHVQMHAQCARAFKAFELILLLIPRFPSNSSLARPGFSRERANEILQIRQQDDRRRRPQLAPGEARHRLHGALRSQSPEHQSRSVRPQKHDARVDQTSATGSQTRSTPFQVGPIGSSIEIGIGREIKREIEREIEIDLWEC